MIIKFLFMYLIGGLALGAANLQSRSRSRAASAYLGSRFPNLQISDSKEPRTTMSAYKVLVEHQKRTVTEYLVCGVQIGTPIKFLNGNIAAAIARHNGELEAVIISEEQFTVLEQQKDVTVIQVELRAHHRQYDEHRLVFEMKFLNENNALGGPFYIALSRDLQAMSPLQTSPELALGLQPGTWVTSP